MPVAHAVKAASNPVGGVVRFFIGNGDAAHPDGGIFMAGTVAMPAGSVRAGVAATASRVKRAATVGAAGCSWVTAASVETVEMATA